MVAALVTVVAGLAVLGARGGDTTGATRRNATARSTRVDAHAPRADRVVATLTSVPVRVLDAVGTGSAVAYPLQVDTPLLGDAARPTVLYLGAEYCPYCAAERWALVLALSRFGRFSNLHLTHSASDDDYPDTQTFTFHGASYDSAFLRFDARELATNRRGAGGSYAPLDVPSPHERDLMTTYDGPPYFGPSSSGGIPFVDFGGRYLVSGASYDPQVLQGLSPERVAAAVRDPSDPVARGVIGSANALTAALCGLTHDRPAAVCTDPVVVAIRPRLR